MSARGFRLSRPCYDKPHRCPGWAGGGWSYGSVDRCEGGSIQKRREGKGVSFGTFRLSTRGRTRYIGFNSLDWQFLRCTKCDVVTWPFALRRLDPSYWWVLAKSKVIVNRIHRRMDREVAS